MDRGTKDEGFVRKALEIAKNEDGRWIANQSAFNGPSESELQPTVHAALVTAVSIYVQQNHLPEAEVEKAFAAKTIGQARSLIDRLSDSMKK